MEHTDESFFDDYLPDPSLAPLNDEELAIKYQDPDELEERRVERMVRLEEEAEKKQLFVSQLLAQTEKAGSSDPAFLLSFNL